MVEKKTKTKPKRKQKNVIYETLPRIRVQEDVFSDWGGKKQQRQRTNAPGIISLLHMKRGQTIKNGVTLCSYSLGVFIIYLFFRIHSKGRWRELASWYNWFEGLFNNLWHETKSSYNGKYAEGIFF